MDMKELTKQEGAVTNYVCDKWYIVDYKRYGEIETVKGFLLNYHNGNIVLLAEKGIYHITYQDIVFMKPIEIPTRNKHREEYLEWLHKLGENNKEKVYNERNK